MSAVTEPLPDLSEAKIKPQGKLVYAALAERGEMSLPTIRRTLERAGHFHVETSISARIRELNKYFRDHGMSLRISYRYANPGSRATLYRITTPDRA